MMIVMVDVVYVVAAVVVVCFCFVDEDIFLQLLLLGFINIRCSGNEHALFSCSHGKEQGQDSRDCRGNQTSCCYVLLHSRH